MPVRATSLSGPKSTAEASTPDPWRTSSEDPVCGWGLTCERADLRRDLMRAAGSRHSPLLPVDGRAFRPCCAGSDTAPARRGQRPRTRPLCVGEGPDRCRGRPRADAVRRVRGGGSRGLRMLQRRVGSARRTAVRPTGAQRPAGRGREPASRAPVDPQPPRISTRLPPDSGRHRGRPLHIVREEIGSPTWLPLLLNLHRISKRHTPALGAVRRITARTPSPWCNGPWPTDGPGQLYSSPSLGRTDSPAVTAVRAYGTSAPAVGSKPLCACCTRWV